jgi:antitoxin ParD1/3/4
MTIDLPSDISEFVKNLVVTGRYPSEQDAVAEGLRLLMSREELKAKIAEGIRELDEGLGIDEETVFAEVEEAILAVEKSRSGS